MVVPFSVLRLDNIPSDQVLLGIAQRFQRMPENERLCRSVLDRLELLHVPVAALNRNDTLQSECADVLVRLLRLLGENPLLARLAKSETTVQIVYDLHLRVDRISEGLDLEEEEGASTGEGGEGRQVGERAAYALKLAVDGQQETPDMLALKSATFDRLTSYTCMPPGLIAAFDWFIPFESLDVEDESIGFGTYGAPRRGTWVANGQRHDVAVKLLYDETGGNTEQAFLNQLHFWFNLAPHKNVLKLNGGNHMHTPPYFVCENAYEGNLVDFFERKGNREHVWSMLAQLAEGLKFLHDQNIVHGGFKCTNVLVLKGRQLSWQTSTSAASGGCLLDSVKTPRLESDTYLLGMCVIEALTLEPPFGYIDDDDDIVAMINHGNCRLVRAGYPMKNGCLLPSCALKTSMNVQPSTKRWQPSDSSKHSRQLEPS
ncbi:Protein kinase-like domain [Phytophthora cactorum]|nr:Protein kinase-like domain [Phytophthora cactorum]